MVLNPTRAATERPWYHASVLDPPPIPQRPTGAAASRQQTHALADRIHEAAERRDHATPKAPRAGTTTRRSPDAYCMLFFNEEHWRKAKWRGMFYELPDDDLPRVGLFFDDGDAGASIFREWRERFGPVDQFDELRISFVFGCIPGEPDGYSVVLSPDLPGVVNGYISRGMRPRPNMRSSLFLEQVKYRRMHAQRSRGWVPEVERFRTTYTPGAPFLLGPARRSHVLSAAGSPQVLFDTSLAIRKQVCFFRSVAGLRHDRDVEACVLPQPTTEGTKG